MDDDSCAVKTKNWLQPACASLLRLEKVSPATYNITLTDPDILSARNLHKTQTGSLQNKTAWGSNASIPDLVKQVLLPLDSPQRQTSINKQARPSSAKTYRSAQQTAARNIRPQSAKDVSLSSKPENTSPPDIGITGFKYDKKSRPPRAPMHTRVSEGWVGPPAGLKMDDFINIISDSQSTIQTDKARFRLCDGDVPPAPQASPEPESTLDGFSEVESITSETEVGSALLCKPTESIHLSLPSAGEDDDQSELDTERVLQEAQAITSHRQEVIVKYYHRPGFSFHHAKVENAGQVSNELVTQVEKYWESPRSRSPSSYNINERTMTLSPSSLDHHLSSRREECGGIHTGNGRGGSVMICEDRNTTLNITPRNRGRKVNDMIAKCYSGYKSKTRTVNFANVKSRVNTGINASAVIAERKNKLNYVSSDTGDDLGLEVDVRSVGKRSEKPPVSIVMVKYNDEEKTSVSNKRDRRRKQEVITMVSQVNMSDSEDDRSKDILDSSTTSFEQTNKRETLHPPSPVQLFRSHPTKNYYEVAMRAGQGKKPDENDEPTENVLYKTIKTIEFDEIEHSPRESSVKSIIPGTTSSTKPRQKLATSVDYLGQLRNASSCSVSMQKATKSTILIPGSPDGHVEKVERAEKSAKLSSSKQIEDKGLKLGKTPSRFLSLPSHKKRPKITNVWHRRDSETESFVSEATDLSTTTPEPPGEQTLVKSQPATPNSTRPNSGTSSKSSTRPSSCTQASLHRMKSFDTRRIQSAALAAEREHKKYAVYTRSFARRQIMQSPSAPKNVVYLNTKSHPDVESEETLACQEMRDKLARLGLNVGADTLERALFPPSGKTLHYEIPRDIPSSPSAGLLSHPKFWLPAEYMKLKIAEKQLARAEQMLWNQKREEEREVKSVLGLTTSAKRSRKRGKKMKKRPSSVS